MKLPRHRERHVWLGHYLKDIVFGANDGIITTFAVVAGVAGAELSSSIVLIVGFANLLADGFSMSTGNYLGTKSEMDFYKKEEATEEMEVRDVPQEEREEVLAILKKKGYAGKELNDLARLIFSNKKHWIDFMMKEELGLFMPETESPLKNGLATFLAFVLAGAIPLLPYVFGLPSSFLLSAMAGGAALFTVGALRKFFYDRPWFLSGLEMLVVGGAAASLAYVVGFALKSVLG